jgi:hypothetical protein
MLGAGGMGGAGGITGGGATVLAGGGGVCAAKDVASLFWLTCGFPLVPVCTIRRRAPLPA